MVAECFGVHPNTAKRWRRAWRDGGEDVLAAKPHPGGKRKLTEEQLDELVELVLAGPLAAGFPTNLWTCDRVAIDPGSLRRRAPRGARRTVAARVGLQSAEAASRRP
jgi:hypothetical protein